MGIEVLGPLTVEGSDGVGPRDRVVLQALVVRADEFVAPDVLADALWGEQVPPSWSKVVQGCIARLRKRLGTTAIETSAYGYRLVGHDDLLDVRRFERLVERARGALAAGDPDRATYLVEEGLLLWRGQPLPDVRDWAPGRAEGERLEGLHREAQELRIEALIAAGRSRGVLEDARLLVTEAPYRETRWALFARALYQSGRQSEALQVLHRARRMLLDDLGLEPGPDLTALQEQILRQDPGLVSAPASAPSEACPWRGLLPYEASDSEAFFGRDREVAEALRRLRERGVLVVVGASGTGKSSLVRAGVVAALRAEDTTVVLTSPGQHPIRSLDPVRRRGIPPVLVVDQAEEAVTLCQDTDERAAYFAELGAHAGPLVMSLRADRLGDLSAYPELAGLVERGLLVLAPMTEDNLRQAIEGPARAAGLRLEPGLVDLLVRDVSGEPGALPLLSHALRQTWERREGPTLTVEGYRLTGGIKDALARSAEQLYEHLAPVERESLRSLFLRLVMPADDGEPVRTRVPRSRLAVDATHESLVESLVAARLVSSDAGDLQIAHEALAREWPRLRGWLQDDMAGQRIFRHLAAAAEAWDAMGRPDSELYRGVRLAAAAEWADRSSPGLTPAESAFLDASRELGSRTADLARQQLAQQRTANRRLRAALVGAAALLLVSALAGVVAVRQSGAAQRRAEEARAATVTADANRLGMQSAQEKDLPTALLLAVEARRLDDSPETRVRLLNALTRERALVRHLPFRDLTGLAFSPDATTYAVGSAGGDGVRVVDARDGRVLASREGQLATAAYLGPSRLAVSTAWTPDLEPDASPVKVLDAHTLDPLPVQLGGQVPDSQANAVFATSRDGRWLVAQQVRFQFPSGGVKERRTSVWDLRHPARPAFVDSRPRDLAFAGFAGGHVLLAWTGLRTIETWDLATHRRMRVDDVPAETGWTFGAAGTSPSGRLLAAVVDGDVLLLDTRTMRPVRRWHTNTTGLLRPVFSPDERLLATSRTDGDGGVVVWETATGRESRQLGEFGGDPNLTAGFAQSGQRVIAAGGGGVFEWDLRRDHGVLASVPSQGVGRTVFARYPSPDGHFLAYVDSAGASPHHFLVQVQDLASGRIDVSAETTKVDGINNASWVPDGRALMVTDGDRVSRVDTTTGRVTVSPSAGLGHLNNAYAVGEHGERLLVTTDAGRVALVDSATMKPVRHYDVKDVLDVGVDGSGRAAFVTSGNPPYQLLDLRTGRVRTLRIKGTIGAFALAPDGPRLATTGDDGVGVYDVRADRWISQDTRRGDSVTWSADGDHVVSTSGSTVTVWDGRSGAQVGTVEAGTATQSSVAAVVPPGQDRVVIAGETGDLHSWDFRPGAWVDRACALAGWNFSREDWNGLVGRLPYHRTCPEHPAG